MRAAARRALLSTSCATQPLAAAAGHAALHQELEQPRPADGGAAPAPRPPCGDSPPTLAQPPAVAVVSPPPPAPPPLRTFFKRRLPPGLVPFSSAEGRAIFADALADGSLESFFPLAQHFTTQAEPASCAAGSLCMVLNALQVDPGAVWRGGWRWWSEDLLLARHWEAAAGLLPAGAPRRGAAEVAASGMSLPEFGALAAAAGLRTDTRLAEGARLEEFQGAVWRALGCGLGCAGGGGAGGGGHAHEHTRRARGGTHVVVSFHRGALQQTGEGHYSPLGGYSRRYGSVLLMDVARFKYPPYWVSLAELWRAMQPPDPATGRSRGWAVLQAAHIPRDSDRCPLAGLVP